MYTTQKNSFGENLVRYVWWCGWVKMRNEIWSINITRACHMYALSKVRWISHIELNFLTRGRHKRNFCSRCDFIKYKQAKTFLINPFRALFYSLGNKVLKCQNYINLFDNLRFYLVYSIWLAFYTSKVNVLYFDNSR